MKIAARQIEDFEVRHKAVKPVQIGIFKGRLGERNYYGISNWGIEKHDYRENNFKIGVNYYF